MRQILLPRLLATSKGGNVKPCDKTMGMNPMAVKKNAFKQQVQAYRAQQIYFFDSYVSTLISLTDVQMNLPYRLDTVPVM